jgi:uncharacterized membrane protein YhhN
MQVYIAWALTVVALVAWLMAFWLPVERPRSQKLALCLAPLAAAWLVALLPPASGNLLYKGAVVLGLLLALLAVLLDQSKFLPGYVAHAHLLLTYALYALAFSAQTSGWPTPFALILPAVAGLLYTWLYPTLFELWSAVALYALLLLLASWQALELAVQQPSGWMGWVAFAGMLLAVVATLLEAQARFRALRPTWAAAALPVFLLAHLAIAWSVWG